MIPNKYLILLTFLALFILGCEKKTQSPTNSEIPSLPDSIQYVVKPQHDIAWPSLADNAWPKSLHDAQCTGRSSYPGPSLGRIKYSISLNNYTTDAVLNSDTSFYIISDSSLYSITFSGKILWKYSLNRYPPNECTPLVDSRGIVYVGTDYGLLTFHSDGKLYWQVHISGGVALKSCGMGLDGTLYGVSGNADLSQYEVFAVDQSGNILWQKIPPEGNIIFGQWSTLSFSPDGSRFYVGGASAKQSLYVFSTDGTILRTDSLGDKQFGSIAVDNDGNVYSYFGNKLMSISPSGDVRWRIPAIWNWNVTIDPYGNIAYLSNDSLFLVDNNGQKRWGVPVHSLDYLTHIVCDAQGTFFIETSDDLQNYDVQAINDDGAILWTLTVSAYVKEAGTSLTKQGYLIFPHSNYSPTTKQTYIIE